MRKDIRGYISKYWRNIFLTFSRYFSTIICRISASLKGINLGNSCRFYGLTYFHRSIDSKIIIGDNCTFRSSPISNLIGINRKCIISTLSPNASISIGQRSGLSGTVIGAFKKISIGDKVLCGANTLITDGDWHLNDPRTSEAKEVYIHDNVWLGEGVKVMKGVAIGENTIIGAGSVVVKSIPANVIAAGNPCKVIKEL